MLAGCYELCYLSNKHEKGLQINNMHLKTTGKCHCINKQTQIPCQQCNFDCFVVLSVGRLVSLSVVG